MKAITTKYHGPTNTRGSRVVADDGDGNRVSLGYRCELNSTGNHAAACRALCEKQGWGGTLQGGTVVKGGRESCMVWVWIERQYQVTVVKVAT